MKHCRMKRGAERAGRETRSGVGEHQSIRNKQLAGWCGSRKTKLLDMRGGGGVPEQWRRRTQNGNGAWNEMRAYLGRGESGGSWVFVEGADALALTKGAQSGSATGRNYSALLGAGAEGRRLVAVQGRESLPITRSAHAHPTREE